MVRTVVLCFSQHRQSLYGSIHKSSSSEPSFSAFHMFEGRPMTFFINYVRGFFVKCIGTWRVYRVLSCYWAENYLVHHQTTVGTGLNVHQRFGIEFRVTKFQNFIVWWIDLFEMVQQVKWMLTNDLVRRRTFVAGTGGTVVTIQLWFCTFEKKTLSLSCPYESYNFKIHMG